MAAGSALVIGVGAEAGLGAQLAHRLAREGFQSSLPDALKRG